VRVALTMTPPPGAPADRLTFHDDAIFHHLITQAAVVTLARDWSNGVTGKEPLLLGTMRNTNAAIVIDRSGAGEDGLGALFGRAGLAQSDCLHGAPAGISQPRRSRR
jgi:hypothetical protein